MGARSVLTLAVALLLGGCGPDAEAPTWDRDVARREVLTAVLDTLFVDDAEEHPSLRVLVVDEALRPGKVYDKDRVLPANRAADVVFLPDGRRKAIRPQIEGLAAKTFEDWVLHTAQIPTPRDLTASRPIEWFSSEGWRALKPPPGITAEVPFEEDPLWAAFHLRFPNSSGLIRLSDVGFSPSHDQAVLQASFIRAPLDGAGYWVLLRREGGRCVVIGRSVTWKA